MVAIKIYPSRHRRQDRNAYLSAIANMEQQEIVNPWITISKKKRNRPFTHKDVFADGSIAATKDHLETIQSNSFDSLSLQESPSGNVKLNGTDSSAASSTVDRPSSPGTSPPRKRSKKHANKKSNYPVIKVRDEFINKKVALTDFRDLLLWMLDDTSSPDWVEVRNKSYIRAAVVLLVPGLSPQTLNIDPTQGSEGRKMRLLRDIQNIPLPNMAEIFKYTWLPKAPGTNTQLYSPVSSFLNCPLTSSQSTQRAKEQPKRKGNSIELESLLMTPIDLTMAGYPIHPLLESGLPDPEFINTPVPAEKTTHRKTVIGMDCEMCKTEQGSEVTRVTLVDFQGNTLYDELVKPKNPIIDYLTPYHNSLFMAYYRWSGITEERLINTTTTLETIQSALVQIIDADTILVGHSLECDLQALKLAHPHVIDTSVIYQHSRGPPYKPSLKWLAQKWLKRKIQDNVGGHDSVEDARACIDLVKLKCRRGKDFGLFNIDVESLFARFKRRGVDSAVVEYGNRGTSFYGDKVRTCLSVESDAMVVDRILEALRTNHGFVWSRMKDVEAAAKWKGLDSTDVNASEMDLVLEEFDAHIERLWGALPPCTALMIITGSGDPREMSKLFAKKKRYEEEYKTKKYDDIQEKWMDGDQQAYMLAVDQARTGLGFIAIK